jgi:hypothetical protein
MRRHAVCLFAVSFLASASAVVSADIRSDQRVRFQLGGAVGKLINMFGGKGAREGVTSTVAVKGNRKATLSDTTGQIIDLSEEKIYDLDMKNKTYKVTTFAELRAEMEKARREAEQQAREMERETPSEPARPSQPAQKDPNQKEFEVDFDLKNTGAARTINGFNTTQTVMTITVREKGKTLNDAGGMVMTTDMWLTKNAPSTDDIAEFDMKYAQKLYGPAIMTGASAQDMAMAMAMYPQIKPALDKMAAEGTKVEGTAILSEMKMEAVPPGTADATAAALPAPAQPEQKKGRFGGLMGGLKKMAEASQQQQSGEQKPQRSIIMTTTVEMLKLTPDVTADVVAIPAGFKETR